MPIIKAFASSVLLTLVLVNSTAAKAWNGITPLSSTRVEVRKVFGEPAKSFPYADYYSLPEEIVVIWYQTAPCDKQSSKIGSGWVVSAGTVTSHRAYSERQLSARKIPG